MALHYGNNDISKIYFGTSEVSKIYYGNTLIYEVGGDIPDNALLDANGNYLVDTTGGYLLTTEIALILFTIDGTTYQAESGMTWAQWVASNYNTDGYSNIIDYIELIENDEDYLVGDSNKPYADNYGRVSPSDIIVSDRSYHLAYMGPAPKEYH